MITEPSTNLKKNSIIKPTVFVRKHVRQSHLLDSIAQTLRFHVEILIKLRQNLSELTWFRVMSSPNFDRAISCENILASL